jgi:hypothetical protein
VSSVRNEDLPGSLLTTDHPSLTTGLTLRFHSFTLRLPFSFALRGLGAKD